MNRKKFGRRGTTRVVYVVGIICPPLIGLGLTNLPKMLKTSPHIPIRSGGLVVRSCVNLVHFGTNNFKTNKALCLLPVSEIMLTF